MNNNQETFDTWNKLAQAYEDKFMKLDIYNESYNLFLETLPPGASVLELGCGPGNVTKYLLDHRPDLLLTGIDIAPNMIRLAKKNNPAAEFKVHDCRLISGFDDRFNGIMAGFCIPYLSEKEVKRLIGDSYHLLLPDGIFYMSFVDGEAADSGFQKGSTGDRMMFYYHDTPAMIADFSDAGYKKTEVLKIDYKRSAEETEIHSVILARK